LSGAAAAPATRDIESGCSDDHSFGCMGTAATTLTTATKDMRSGCGAVPRGIDIWAVEACSRQPRQQQQNVTGARMIPVTFRSSLAAENDLICYAER